MPTESIEKASRSVRALQVMESMAATEQPMSTAEIAVATGLPKATTHRICGLLEKQSFLAADVGGKGYRPGQRMRDLALGIIATGADHAFRHSVLAEVSREIGETCNLNAPMGGEMIYLDRVETEWPLRTQLPIGSRVPLHCTASGKLYLSSLSEARRHRMVAALPLTRHTAKTITDAKQLISELNRIDAEGLGTDNEEFIDGMTAIALPITDTKGRLTGTLACHAPSQRMSLDVARSYIPVLRRAARALSVTKTKER